MKLVAFTALLLVAPALCGRPVDDTKAWLVQHFGAAKSKASEVTSADDKPWFCHDIECPGYKVTNKTDAYELRAYDKNRWASTHVEGIFYAPSVGTGFKRLFDYISGDNEDSKKIPMTAPVLTAVQPGQGPFCKSNFTVAFYVPVEFEENTPEPTSKDVYIATSPAGEIYVSQFGGYVVEDYTLAAKVKALREALIAAKQDFVDDGTYFTASYDPPFRVQHRHNEIWIPKKKTSSNVVASAIEALPFTS